MSEAGLRQKAEKAAVRTRQRNENIRQNISEKRSEEMIRNTIMWRDKIIPKWKSVKNSSKVYTLATKGIPPCLRRQVWQLMIGNEIVVTEDVYRSLHEKAVIRYQQVQQREKLYTAAKKQQEQFAVALSQASGDGTIRDTPVTSPCAQLMESGRDDGNNNSINEPDECDSPDLPVPGVRIGRSKSQEGTVSHLEEEDEVKIKSIEAQDERGSEYFSVAVGALSEGSNTTASVNCNETDLLNAPILPSRVLLADGVVRTLRLRSYSANDSNNNTSSNGNILATALLVDAASNRNSAYNSHVDAGVVVAAEGECTEEMYAFRDDKEEKREEEDSPVPASAVTGGYGHRAEVDACLLASVSVSASPSVPESISTYDEVPAVPAATTATPGATTATAAATAAIDGQNKMQSPMAEDEITRIINKFNRSHHYTALGMDYSAVKAGPVLTPDISVLGSRTQGGPSNVTPLLAGGAGMMTPASMLHTPRGRLDSNTGPVDSGHRFDTVALIQYDLPRTFPTLGFFHDGGPLNDALNKVLHAFSCFRPDVGYVQGMSYIVAMLLLYMSELETFQALINLVGRRACLEFYRLKKEAIDNYVQVFNYFFKQTLPMLFDHFAHEGVTSEMYLLDWNLSLFCKALPLEVAARIWDCYLLEGEVFIVRTALGLLRMYAPTLCVQSMEQIMKTLVHFPDNIDVDEILANIEHIKISNKKYEQMRRKYDLQDLSMAGVTATANARDNRNRSGKSSKFPLLTALGLYTQSNPGPSGNESWEGSGTASSSSSVVNSPNSRNGSDMGQISPSFSDCGADSCVPATSKPRNPKQVQAEHEARMRLINENQQIATHTHARDHDDSIYKSGNGKSKDDNCIVM